jgi:hypothetical protein
VLSYCSCIEADEDEWADIMCSQRESHGRHVPSRSHPSADSTESRKPSAREEILTDGPDVSMPAPSPEPSEVHSPTEGSGRRHGRSQLEAQLADDLALARRLQQEEKLGTQYRQTNRKKIVCRPAEPAGVKKNKQAGRSKSSTLHQYFRT